MPTSSPLRRSQVAFLCTILAALCVPSAATASVTSAQIYVRTKKIALLDAAVSDYLSGYAKHEGAAKSPYFQAKTGRRVVVLPPRAGWATILEVVDGQADPTLAEGLSRALKTKVVWIQVLGGSFSYRAVVLEKGKIVETHAEPTAGYGGAPSKGPMPMYQDIEPIAWAFLGQQGIPVAYRFLRQVNVGVSKHPKTGPQAAIFRVVAGKKGALEVGAGHFGFTLPRRERKPPIVVDAFIRVKGSNGANQGLDMLALSGRPTPKALENLAHILREKRKRYMRHGKFPFCYVVQDPYRIPVFTKLAAEPGPCQPVYRRFLQLAKAAAAKAKAKPTPKAKPAGH